MQDWGFRTTAGIYTFTEQRLPDETPQREVGHHIFVIDRSGSMWAEMEALKGVAKSILGQLDPDIQNAGLVTGKLRKVEMAMAVDQHVILRQPWVRQSAGTRPVAWATACPT